MLKTARSAAAIIALALSAGLAANRADAQVVITSDTTIAPGDPAYQNQDIIVRGCTVAINGAHSFNSLTIQRNEANVPGVVTHSPTFSADGVNGMFITLTGDLIVQGPAKAGLVASKIDVTGKGFPKGQGPGTAQSVGGRSRPSGASHAGEGGIGSYLSTGGPPQEWYNLFLPAACYGSITAPADHGSGGGMYIPLFGPPSGADGGGCVRIDAQGDITVDGDVLADGQHGAGGAAGGTIFLSAQNVHGSGQLHARGGNASGGGGGGGGRICIIATNSSFPGSISAGGGATAAPFGPTSAGGAGTVYLQTGISPPRLIIDNQLSGTNIAVGATQLSGDVTTDADVTLAHNARVGPMRGDPSPLHWTINGTLTIDATSAVTASGRGLRPGPAGNGGFGSFQNTPGGGGHGGAGGAGANPIPPLVGIPGATHGDPNAPTSFGGSGGSGEMSPMGFGGGALRLTVSGELTLQGMIASDGGGRAPDDSLPVGGGCAGGSVWIEAPTVSGTGSIFARGSNAGSGGGGGGGRIRIDSCTFGIASGDISVAPGAASGLGAQPGQPGSIVIAAAQPAPTISTQPPVGVRFAEGDTVSITVGATPEPLAYQWRRAGTPLSDDKTFAGTTTPTLTITGATCGQHAGSYDVVVTHAVGCSAAAFSDPSILRSFADYFDPDGVVNSTDVSFFINDWFMDQEAGSLHTDINGDGVSNSTDVSDFINNWFAAIAGGC